MAGGIIAALDDLGNKRTERVRAARALYEREYSRPVYETKIRQLLEIVA
jgi:hypothetical protein